MKFKQVTIKPKAFESGWHVNIYNDGIERVKKKQKPSALGFYHCFETVPDDIAVNELLDVMIIAHQKEIDDTIASKCELEKLRR